MLDAIVKQDVDAIRRVLANGIVNVNEWIDPDLLRSNNSLDIHNATYVDWPAASTGYGGRRVWLTRHTTQPLRNWQLPTIRGNAPDSLLGMAVLSGAPQSVEALIDAGALPRPTREFLLNSALSRLNASHYTFGDDYTQYPIDALGTAAVLLRRFGRSPRLHPLDMNPLSVARATLQRSLIAAQGDTETVERSVDAALVPLLAAGYTPDERMQAVGPPPVLVTDSRRRIEYEPALRHDYGSPADYDVARAALARITERQALGSGQGGPIDIAQYIGPDSRLEVLSQPRDRLTARVARLYDLYSASQEGSSPTTITHGFNEIQGDGNEEGEQAQNQYESAMSLLESLPPEVAEMIAASPGLSARDVAALYATSSMLREAAARPLRQRRDIFQAFMAPGAPCGDYAGCMATLLAAIARDDPTDVLRVLESRVIGLNDLLDPSGRTLYGNPLTVVTTQEPADGRLGSGLFDNALYTNSIGRAYAGERLLFTQRQAQEGIAIGQRGWNYATPLALAAIAKAPDVVRELAAAGARPWPSIESLLERALNRPFDPRMFVLGINTTGYDGTSALRKLVNAGVLETVQLADDEPLPRTEPLGPNTKVLIREADTPGVVRALVESYPRSVRFHHGDANPLTVLRLFTLETLNDARHSPPNPAAIEAALAPLIDILLEAGYSPDERGLPCDADPEGTTERALVTRWATDTTSQSIRKSILADIFGRAYARVLPPLVSPDSPPY